MASQINWAIVGCGSIAERRIAPGLAKSNLNRLVAVTSPDQAKAEAFAARHGGARAYASLEAMLADPDVGVVYVGSPNALHHDHVIAACQAGKHVFCEKPMALSIADCEAMARAARGAGVKLGIGFNNRYNPVHQEIRRRLAIGEIGEVRSANLLYAMDSRRQRWRLDAGLAGAGSLYDMGVHGIDLMRFLIGEDVRRVTAFMDFRTHGWPLDEAIAGLMEFASGAVANLTISSNTPYPRNAVSVQGAKGTLVAVETLVSQRGEGAPPVGRLEATTADGSEVIDFEAMDIFQAELDAFGRAVAEDRAPDIGADDGIRAQEIALAMRRSHREGVTVSLPFDETTAE